MDDYNYRKEVKSSVLCMLKDNHVSLDDVDEDDIMDMVYNSDVLGARSGSFFCDNYKAKMEVFSNTDLLSEALQEFCYSEQPDVIYEHLINENFEWFDIIIREYVLPGVVNEIMEEHNGVDE